ncbi:MAG: S24/S26 family peptidase [Clostridia bacterium]|nr:S24/S26 family peptidase [Clostridia bacterium]MBQ8850778.1 S24/S26 family peptidase [Clostridia bacterium]
MNNGEFYLADAIDVIEEILSGGGEFRMYPKGTSMLPLIVQGKDSVVLKRNFECAAKKHDIAFYRRTNGQFVLHRVMKICDDGTYVMCGDNQTELEYGIKKEQIIGYVDRIYKEDKEHSLDSFGHRLYLFFWCFMPYRKTWRFVKGKFFGLKRRLKKLFGKNK